MATLSDFRSSIIAHTPGCPNFIIEAEVLKAARAFCKDTRIWQDTTEEEQLLEIDVDEVDTAYALNITEYSANMISNGGFDSSTSGWVAMNAGCTLASIAGGQDDNCLELTRVSGSMQFAMPVLNLTVIEGETYRVTVWVKSGTSGDESFHVDITGDEWALLSIIEGTTSDTWTQYQASFVATAYQVTEGFKVYLRKNTSTAGTMLFDSVSMQRVSSGEKNIIGISSVTRNDYIMPSDQYSLDAPNSNIIFATAPTLNDTITVRRVYRPSIAATTLPDFLLEDCEEAISAKAVSELILMPGKPWSNPAAVVDFRSRYNGLVHETISKALKGGTSRSLSVRSKEFGFLGSDNQQPYDPTLQFTV